MLMVACLFCFGSLFLQRVSAQSVEEGYIHTPDGVRLYYQKIGSGSSTIILPARLYTFEEFKRLGDQFTLISYDMRNRGRSDLVAESLKVTIEADVDDLETVRKHFGVEKFTPVGYSYLGLMVVLYELEHPGRVDRLIQVGPVPLKFGTPYEEKYVANDRGEILTEERLQPLRELRQKNFHVTHPREYCEKEWEVTSRLLVGDPRNAHLVAKSPCDMPPEWPVNLARHFRLHFQESVQKLDVAREMIQSLQIPVLTIHGTRDRNAPYAAGREWAYLLPQGRLLTVDGTAHHVFAERPELVFPAIRKFMAGQWPAASEKVIEDPRKLN